MLLKATMVKLRDDKHKNRGKASAGRMGYQDDNSQAYLPPKKNEEAWKKKMMGLGYTFV